jgi:hypothetical protein
MTITNEQLAELLAGIARSQQAIIDAVDRAEPGFRNTHLVPVLTVAANMRLAEGRLLDLPSRILLRGQGRAAMDTATVLRDLEAILTGVPVPLGATAGAPQQLPPAAQRAAAKAAAAGGAAAPAAAARPAPAPVAAPAAARPAPPPAGGDDMDFTAKT